MGDPKFKFVYVSSIEDLHDAIGDLGAEGVHVCVAKNLTHTQETDTDRFRRMVEDFKYFSTQASNFFVPCGFLHELMGQALSRAYDKTYAQIGKAKDTRAVTRATRATLTIKRCEELHEEIADKLTIAFGDTCAVGDANLIHIIKESMVVLKDVK